MIRAAFTQALGAFLADQLRLRWKLAESRRRYLDLEDKVRDVERRAQNHDVENGAVRHILKDAKPQTIEEARELLGRLDRALNDLHF